MSKRRITSIKSDTRPASLIRSRDDKDRIKEAGEKGMTRRPISCMNSNIRPVSFVPSMDDRDEIKEAFDSVAIKQGQISITDLPSALNKCDREYDEHRIERTLRKMKIKDSIDIHTFRRLAKHSAPLCTDPKKILSTIGKLFATSNNINYDELRFFLTQFGPEALKEGEFNAVDTLMRVRKTTKDNGQQFTSLEELEQVIRMLMSKDGQISSRVAT
ncbi:MAG: hypothetical protein MHMPM18_003377 [Marteilia pararefringens]